MAIDLLNREANCPFDHPAGCIAHGVVMYEGEQLDVTKHVKLLRKEGLSEIRTELIQEKKRNSKPPGTPKLIHGVLIYPTRHFA